MHIAILTFDGYNELDSLIALGILNRVKKRDWRVFIASPSSSVTSMNGVTINRHISLEDAQSADAVLIGSGIETRKIARDDSLLETLHFDANKQLIGGQCSGTLIMAKLGLLNGVPACTDLNSKPWVEEAGIDVLNQPFYARDNIATSGGCLASHYLAAWVIACFEGKEAAKSAIHYVAPVGEKAEYVDRAMNNIEPYLNNNSVSKCEMG